MVPVTVWRPAMVAVQVLGSVGVQEPSGAMVKSVEPVASKELPWASVPVAW
jgi:hypothetical protein